MIQTVCNNGRLSYLMHSNEKISHDGEEHTTQVGHSGHTFFSHDLLC